MKTFRQFVFATAALAALISGSPASAADYPAPQWIPGKPDYKTPQWIPGGAYDWTGAYVGLNGGGVFGQSSWLEVPTGNFNVSGGIFGATGGYNFQAGSPLVIGGEVDLNWLGVSGSTANNCFPNCQTRSTWLSTARLRVGCAFERIMPYVTGGISFGDIRAELAGQPLGSESTMRFSYVIGGGVEFAIAGPLTGKLEYLYTDLRDITCNAACGGMPITVKLNESIVRVGLNYRLWTK
jgi:outer membrane immunogenic protein